MGAGKLLWGYHPATKTWIPLQVDANGKVIVDMSAIKLDDLADVDLTGLADDDFFYYDLASGLWKPRKLVDADIPAGIARDAEVADAVAAEATARAADVDAEEAARIAADTGHAALTTGVHGIDIPLFSTANKSYYIDEVNGDDANGGEASDDAFETWAKMKGIIPIFLMHTWTIYIIGDLSTIVDLEARLIGGELLVRGFTTTAAGHTVPSIKVYNVNGKFHFNYLKITTSTVDIRYSLLFAYTLRYCDIMPSGIPGTFFSDCIAGLVQCAFGTDIVTTCIQSQNSRIYSYLNSGNGTQYGLHASMAGTIGKNSTQPTGTTANEFTQTGGVIR